MQSSEVGRLLRAFCSRGEKLCLCEWELRISGFLNRAMTLGFQLSKEKKRHITSQGRLSQSQSYSRESYFFPSISPPSHNPLTTVQLCGCPITLGYSETKKCTEIAFPFLPRKQPKLHKPSIYLTLPTLASSA